MQVLPNLHLVDNASTTAILLHDNLLSCRAPWCGNASARTSIVAIGNRLRHPKGEFPQWVSKYEQDPLFWVSGDEGMSMLKGICGAVIFLMLVMAWRLDAARWLREISSWQIGPTAHLWLVQAFFHLVSCLVKESLLAAIFLMFLLFWDLYACPQTLAIASACLRNSALVRAFVFLCWCQLSFHSLAAQHLMMERKSYEKKQQWTVKMLRKKLMLWLLWSLITVVFSSIASLYQMSSSIPGFLPVGKIWSLGLKACVGTIQGVVGIFIVPAVASRVTWDRYTFTTFSNLIMNCLIPIVIIMYLDTGCLGRWVAFWKPCQSNRELFQRSLICKTQNEQDCRQMWLHKQVEIDTVVVRSSDICDPHHSWSLTSISNCMHILLLRLQEIWLSKFITAGLMMPGIAILRGAPAVKSEEVVARFAIYMAYAMVSSGHLPLMMPILLLAVSIAGFLATVAWARRGIRPVRHDQNVAAPVLRMTRLLSLIVHLASAAGDPRALAMAGAYVFMLILANGIGKGDQGWKRGGGD